MVVYVVFLCDVACQKLLNSANVSRSYSQNNTGAVFFETRCIYKCKSSITIAITIDVPRVELSTYLLITPKQPNRHTHIR